MSANGHGHSRIEECKEPLRVAHCSAVFELLPQTCHHIIDRLWSALLTDVDSNARIYRSRSVLLRGAACVCALLDIPSSPTGLGDNTDGTLSIILCTRGV